MRLASLLGFVICAISLLACSAPETKPRSSDAQIATIPAHPNLRVGAERLEAYLPRLEGKSVAVVANATSRIGDTHLVDTLLQNNITITKVFAPEHGFRGQRDAGEKVDDEVDAETGLPILSLYGKNKKPSPKALQGVDIIIYDIQDVGVRFYTYLSTLHYVMEACAENDIPLIILDRPNPNGFYIDGPVLDTDFASFVGLHPVPLVYGMTIGEYGRMINGQSWLAGSAECDLTIIEIENYSRDMLYELPVPPSPNLPNMTSIYRYPSLALFEGTVVSIGRGTPFPFQVAGHPDYADGNFEFTPQPMFGAMQPKLQGQKSRGLNLRSGSGAQSFPEHQLRLDWITDFYAELPDKDGFFLPSQFFDKLAGTDRLMVQIKAGQSPDDIRESWKDDLRAFKTMREPYLIYE